jgi:hypothetical protein
MSKVVLPLARPLLAPLLLAPLLLAAAPAVAVTGGPLGTLPLGDYVCETGGDATGLPGVHQPQFDFTVTRASTYRIGRNRASSGSYLMTSDRIVFTSGPREGMKFHQVRPGFLRLVDGAEADGALRCVRKPGSSF